MNKTKQKITQRGLDPRFVQNESHTVAIRNLVLFFQYVGIFSVFFVINIAVVLSYLISVGEIKVVKVEKHEVKRVVSSKNNLESHYLSYVGDNSLVTSSLSKEKKEIQPSKSLTALINYDIKNTNASFTPQVLGTKTKKAIAAEGADLGVCSFKQGNKLYSNQSKITLKRSELHNHLCVNVADVATSNFLWNINGNSSQGNCIDLSSYDLYGGLEAFVYVDNLQQSSACRLLIERVIL